MTDYQVIVVGASLGGMGAMSELLEVLPPELEAPVVLAQHRSSDSPPGQLEQLLQRYTARTVVGDVLDKCPLEPFHVYVAPADYHLLVEPGGLALSVDERVMWARPSIDVLFESAADAYGPRAIGIVLTGANADGAAGLARIKRAGGVAIIQDPDTAQAPTMPRAVLQQTAVDAVLPVSEIGKFLYGLAVAASEVRA